jgi:hypothetical protein
MHETTTAHRHGAIGAQRRVAALAALAVWAGVVPWLARALGTELDVATRLEVVDHVVPGAIVVCCCALLLRLGRRPGSLARLGAIAVAALAGFWITATHAILVTEALDGVSPWGAALLHLSAGPPVTIIAVWMLLAEAAP